MLQMIWQSRNLVCAGAGCKATRGLSPGSSSSSRCYHAIFSCVLPAVATVMQHVASRLSLLVRLRLCNPAHISLCQWQYHVSIAGASTSSSERRTIIIIIVSVLVAAMLASVAATVMCVAWRRQKQRHGRSTAKGTHATSLWGDSMDDRLSSAKRDDGPAELAVRSHLILAGHIAVLACLQEPT